MPASSTCSIPMANTCACLVYMQGKSFRTTWRDLPSARHASHFSFTAPLFSALSPSLFLYLTHWQSAYTLIYFCNINDVDAYVNVNGSENSKSNKAEKYTHWHTHKDIHTKPNTQRHSNTQATYVWLSSSWCYFFVFFLGRTKRST